MNITKGQYLLTNKRIPTSEFKDIIKFQDYYLYIGDNLPIAKTKTKDNEEILLVGQIYCMDQVGKVPSTDINDSELCDIINATKYWTGRWVLIAKNFLITDASGIMSAFYTEIDSTWFISSSLAVLSNTLSIKIESKVSDIGLTWQLLPYTLIEGVHGLFCTQIIVLNRTSIEVKHLNRFRDYRNLTTEEKIEKISEFLVNALKNISKFSGKKILIALTSGKDSRLTVAAALKAGIDFDTYTAEHELITKEDCILPPKIANDLNFKHNFIPIRGHKKLSLKEYYQFCGNNSNGVDALFYSNGQFSEIKNNTVVVRSGIFEAGQNYGRPISKDEENFKENFSNYYKHSLTDHQQKNALQEWLKYSEENPINFVDIRDRFYIEQRVNGWISAIEQSLCINDFDSIQIANCVELISILLSASKEERRNLAIAVGSLSLLNKKISEYPINKIYMSDKFKRLKKNFFKKLMFHV